jgi:hypothetical protein
MQNRLKLFLLFTSLLATVPMAMAQEKTDLHFFELRTYYCHPGKLSNLLERFEKHTMGLFEKHGMTNLAYFVPVENKDNKLVYLMGYPSKEARDSSWDAFRADAQWQTARDASEASGAIVQKIVSEFLTPTNYSMMNLALSSNRIFELRRYTATPSNLAILDARFRNHTINLFQKHSMTNIMYFHEPGLDNKLIYFLAHKSVEAAKNSFADFGADPDWQKAKVASETLANGAVMQEITSEYLVPTSFSPLQ